MLTKATVVLILITTSLLLTAMISISMLHPSQPTTIGEFRALTARLPDHTPIVLDECLGDNSEAPAIYLDIEDNTLCITKPF